MMQSVLTRERAMRLNDALNQISDIRANWRAHAYVSRISIAYHRHHWVHRHLHRLHSGGVDR